ncbi:MAG: PAS domain S-box protein [Chloroflexi bacterium]|nr:PAS domain S-box protein [Chloroflexota bacterium]MCI0577260.1 PAS domain S-box protein [Chloroflexota bacterium]MCI0646741.1 PAS domain S-box protein [Chloroflexota bacterium]MCI0731375.1 PAS domain S-box protein [Chloroflexota bacterium]
MIDENEGVARLKEEVAQANQRCEALETENARLRQTLAGLQASERKYRDLVESANGIILDWDLDGRVSFINRFGQEFFGFQEEEIVGRSVIGTIVPETDSTGRNLQAVMADIQIHPERYQENENENLTKDGRRAWVVWWNKAIFDENGVHRGIRSVGNDITKRKQAEAAMRDSEERYRLLLESSPDAIVLYDLRGNATYINPAFTQMFGWRPEDVIGRPIEFVPEELKAQVQERLAYGLKTGRVPPFETRRYRKDGTLLDVSISGALFFDRDHNPAGSFIILRDITRRRRAEEAIRRQNEYLAALHETTLGLITRLDIDDLLEALLTRAGQLLGAPHGFVYLVTEDGRELEGKLSVGALSQAIGLRVKPGEGVTGRVWQTGQPLVIYDYDNWPGRLASFEYGAIRAIVGVPLKSGEQVIGVLGLAYSPDSEGTFGHEEVELLSRFGQLVSIALDNARLYTAAQREKEYFKAVVQISPVAILIVDLDVNVVGWNPAAEKLFGYTQAEAIGRNLDILIARGTTHDEALNFSRQAIQEGHLHALTQRTRKDGTLVDVEMAVVPVVVDGKRLGFIGIYHDISELQRARREAEAANQSKGAFLASVSHELRTPLTSILGFAKIIQKRLEQRLLPAIPATDGKTQRAMEQVLENVQIIVAEGERLTSLINDVLDLAKIEAGKVEWHMESLAVAEVIERATAATAGLFLQKRLPLIKDIPTDLPLIVGDRDRLIQVLINLISNAVKFTERGSVTCRARQANGEVVVSVSDTGIGIAAADLPKVFEKFKQVGDTLTDKPRGTGLGLAICKEIVEHHLGHIWVESDLGLGSTFAFSLPVEGVVAGEVVATGQADPRVRWMDVNALVSQLRPHLVSAGATAEATGQKRILVVDDDANIRALLRQELAAEGYLVYEAEDGRQALTLAQQISLDLIILDVMMPELNGFDVAAVLKNNPQTMNTPIMILSIIEDRERGYRLGVDRYLTKPIDTQVLLQEAETLLAQGSSSRRVLVVDANASTVRTLTEALQAKGYQVVGASTGEEAVQTALSSRPDMIILNAVLSQQGDIVKTLRFEKGLENVLFLLFQ